MRRRPSRPVRLLAPVLGLVCLLAACGTTPAAPAAAPPSSTGAYPVTVDSAGTPLAVQARPVRVVSLSPTATEDLFAVGAGSQVVAVDDQSTFPAQAPRTKLSGFTPNVEAVAAYRPDLVVVSDDLGGVVSGLRALKVPVLLAPAAKDLDQAWAQLQAIGTATGHPTEAAQLVEVLRARVDEAVAAVPAAAKGLRVYHELDNTLYTATSATFVGSIEKRLGLVNVADAAAKAGSGYPQLSAEYLVKAAPQVVVLADTVCCAQTAATFAARPGFARLPAVVQGRVVGVDDAVASRWGPRIVDLAEQLAKALRETAAG